MVASLLSAILIAAYWAPSFGDVEVCESPSQCGLLSSPNLIPFDINAVIVATNSSITLTNPNSTSGVPVIAQSFHITQDVLLSSITVLVSGAGSLNDQYNMQLFSGIPPNWSLECERSVPGVAISPFQVVPIRFEFSRHPLRLSWQSAVYTFAFSVTSANPSAGPFITLSDLTTTRANAGGSNFSDPWFFSSDGTTWAENNSTQTPIFNISLLSNPCSCIPPIGSCLDGVQNTDEDQVDCGGRCGLSFCFPTCCDGRLNGDEIMVDCGGECNPCPVPPTCTDGIQNGDETGVDCGGSCPVCPVDCVLSPWSAFSPCSTACPPTHTRTRTIISQAVGTGLPCSNFPLNQTINCNIDCTCLLSDWTAWSQCTATCVSGSVVPTQTRTRTIIVEAQDCASQPLVQNQTCNSAPCSTDCVLSSWTDWGACSASCTNSTNTPTQSRTRTILSNSTGDGVPCTNFSLTSTRNCSSNLCPINCVVSEWSDWSPCPASCHDPEEAIPFQLQTRSIITPPANNGTSCPELTKARECNTNPCPINCEVSEWSPWGECSSTCRLSGSGAPTQISTRNITTNPENNGTVCPSLTRTQNCSDFPCPFDCVLSEWSGWSDCSVSCVSNATQAPTQSRTRTIISEAVGNGTQCSNFTLNETQPCSPPTCAVDCQVSEWSNWSPCSASCQAPEEATPFQSQTRNVTVAPVGNGTTCPELTNVRACNTFPCEVSCEVSPWSSWSACSATCKTAGGPTPTQTQTRQVVTNGTNCPELTRTKVCNNVTCSSDCVMSPWSTWGTCTATCSSNGVTPSQTRTRTVTTPPTGNGSACQATSQSQPCNTCACPSNCVVSPWGAWSYCTATCTTTQKSPTKTRMRSIVTQPSGYGTPCPPLTETQPCNNIACPVNCVVSAWTAWSCCGATCAVGGIAPTQSRSRTITTQPVGTGTCCPALQESRTCNLSACPVDCLVSAWGAWGYCSVTCGTGSQTRSRSVTRSPSGVGAIACPSLTDTKYCTNNPCTDCSTSAWSYWSTCAQTCTSNGVQPTRTSSRTFARGGTTATCPYVSLTRVGTCSVPMCAQNCVLSSWAAWSACSATCNNGVTPTKSRRREIVIPAAYGGRACESLMETVVCNNVSCRADCQVSAWGTWGACSATCAASSSYLPTQIRTRSKLQDAKNGGLSCSYFTFSQSRNCNTQRCTLCNDGVKNGDETGVDCGGSCNRCRAVDCVVSVWGAWGSCSATCNPTYGRVGSVPPVRVRSRSVVVLGANGGISCNGVVLNQTQACNDIRCGY